MKVTWYLDLSPTIISEAFMISDQKAWLIFAIKPVIKIRIKFKSEFIFEILVELPDIDTFKLLLSMYSENHGLNSSIPAFDLRRLKNQSPFTARTMSLTVSPEGFFASRSLKLAFFRIRLALSLSERAPITGHEIICLHLLSQVLKMRFKNSINNRIFR